MSNSSSTQPQRSSGGENRGERGSRNRGGRNRRGGNRGGNNRGGNNRGGRNRGGPQQGRSSSRHRTPKPAPLTWWQKILKAVGLYDPEKAPKRTAPSRVPKQPEAAKKAPKSRTRVAKTAEESKKVRESRPEDVESTRLYIGNLSFDATEYDLEDLFKGVGPVNSVEIVYNRNTHKSKGYGFIEMRVLDDARRAVEVLHDQPFMGRELIVSGAKSSGPQESSPGGDSEEAA